MFCSTLLSGGFRASMCVLPMRLKRVGYVCVAALFAALWTGACQETTTLPIVPTTLPPDKVGVLNIFCPADQTILSLNGTNAGLDYPSPQTTGGQAPVFSSCAPAAGTVLPVGTVPVECNASDDLGQTAACAFSVRILSPRLLRTKFLAFGDSLTAGEVSYPISTILQISKSYPFKLGQMLGARYPTQTIEMVNAGLSGETAIQGLNRIGLQVDAVRPEVVLILQGTNDLSGSMFDLNATNQALDGMIRASQTRGAEPIIATVPPVRVPGREIAAANIPSLNSAIRSLAVSSSIRLVDVFTALSTGSCAGSNLPCIGVDNLHPTAMGYEVMAQAFMDVIMEEYDVQSARAQQLVLDNTPDDLLQEPGP